MGTRPGAASVALRPSASHCAAHARHAYNALHEVLARKPMFFKKNGNSRRRVARARGATLSPRFARLVRESWWLLVVAAFLYLALILVTYTKADPGWSFTGTGAPIANRGGVVGAWLSDLLLYLFGLSAWWWVVGGVVLVVARLSARRAAGRTRASIRSPLGAHRLRARAAVERRARSDPPVAAAGDAAARARRRVRRCRSARRLRTASASTARRCCCSRCSRSARRCSSACRGCA